MAYEGLAILKGLEAIQGVTAIAGNLENLRLQKMQRQEEERKQARLNKLVDYKKTSFYGMLGDEPRLVVDTAIKPYLHENGLITIGEMGNFSNEMSKNIEFVNSMDRASTSYYDRMFEITKAKATNLAGKKPLGWFDPEVKELMGKANDFAAKGVISKEGVSKQREYIESLLSPEEAEVLNIDKKYIGMPEKLLEKIGVIGKEAAPQPSALVEDVRIVNGKAVHGFTNKLTREFNADRLATQAESDKYITGKTGEKKGEERQWSNDARRALVTLYGGKITPEGSFMFEIGTQNEGALAMQFLDKYKNMSPNTAAVYAKRDATKIYRQLPDPTKYQDNTLIKVGEAKFRLINGRWEVE